MYGRPQAGWRRAKSDIEVSAGEEPTMNVTILGEPRFPSPIRRTVSDSWRVPEQIVRDPQAAPAEELLFELAGPRQAVLRSEADPRRHRHLRRACAPA